MILDVVYLLLGVPALFGAVVLWAVVFWFFPFALIGVSYQEITKRWHSHNEEGLKGVMLSIWSVWPWVVFSLGGMLWVRYVSFRMFE